MRDGIFAVRGQSYLSQQGFSLYATSGTSEDWAFTREFLDPSRVKLSGFVIEFNKDYDFFPTWAEMVDLILDIDAGLVALCVHATPGRWAVILCWMKERVWSLWHRVFKPELWGPVWALGSDGPVHWTDRDDSRPAYRARLRGPSQALVSALRSRVVLVSDQDHPGSASRRAIGLVSRRPPCVLSRCS